jgi:hypothetical protein
MKKILLLLTCVSPMVFAGEIGFGKVDAIKVYDFSNSKIIKIYLSSDSVRTNIKCEENARTVGIISPKNHSESTINRMVSLATAAQMAGKKIRLYSEQSNSCEIDFVGLQEVYF